MLNVLKCSRKQSFLIIFSICSLISCGVFFYVILDSERSSDKLLENELSCIQNKNYVKLKKLSRPIYLLLQSIDITDMDILQSYFSLIPCLDEKRFHCQSHNNNNLICFEKDEIVFYLSFASINFFYIKFLLPNNHLCHLSSIWNIDQLMTSSIRIEKENISHPTQFLSINQFEFDNCEEIEQSKWEKKNFWWDRLINYLNNESIEEIEILDDFFNVRQNIPMFVQQLQHFFLRYQFVLTPSHKSLWLLMKLDDLFIYFDSFISFHLFYLPNSQTDEDRPLIDKSLLYDVLRRFDNLFDIEKPVVLGEDNSMKIIFLFKKSTFSIEILNWKKSEHVLFSELIEGNLRKRLEYHLTTDSLTFCYKIIRKMRFNIFCSSSILIEQQYSDDDMEKWLKYLTDNDEEEYQVKSLNEIRKNLIN
ncbi:hypothetical protein SNEBB_007155 [Seison nebaliae]|nr:hypothetical protein SNEBB_007155 [Seison nebaliae]